MLKTKNGFTIVELLVLVVIIGILAFISIISYSVIIDRANDAKLAADLKNGSSKIKSYYSTYGSYPASLNASGCPVASGSLPADTNYCVTVSSGNTIYSYSTTGQTFSLVLSSPTSKRLQSTQIISQIAYQSAPSCFLSQTGVAGATTGTAYWSLVTGATNYTIQFRNDTLGSYDGPYTTTNLTKVSNVLAVGSNWYAVVSANNSDSCTTGTITSLAAAQPAPTCSLSRTGSSSASTGTASWSAVSGATSYTVNFINNILPDGDGPYTTTSLSQTSIVLAGGSGWYATVRANNSNTCTTNTITSLTPSPGL